MTTFLIVLIAILVICCGIMLYLYFSVRKEADDYAHEYRRYSELYVAAKSDKEFYRDELDKRLEENIELEKVSKDATELLGRKDSEIKLLRKQVNDRTVNYTTTTVSAYDANGSIIIPREIFKNEDPVESSLFYKSVWDTLVNIIAKDILSDSARFNIEYDISKDAYHLCFHYKKFLSKDYKSNGYRIEPWSESPVEELINRIRKQEEKTNEHEDGV